MGNRDSCLGSGGALSAGNRFIESECWLKSSRPRFSRVVVTLEEAAYLAQQLEERAEDNRTHGPGLARLWREGGGGGGWNYWPPSSSSRRNWKTEEKSLLA
ncbi:hypothetical protein EYF80_011410 [Liparis tanakae]|uniref:Uncharacterized protein n=1 Tax=Liparis tanakae TaxID=230148 RepID=A0A4Z2IKJ5_9TELE|nr:hypothetical protein EYF80_011410 [Liparis tanakae]